ncbi:MAG: radical SAM protein [Clostridia bacterium]|nr:radical SAM protein [Clostridia bacterium]
MSWIDNCNLCPRRCGANRKKGAGFCGCQDEMVVSKTMLHHWEEPVISGDRGSGAIFFSGCNLKCNYCQNREISFKISGERLDSASLAGKMLDLQNAGAHNINLVTAAPYSPLVKESLKLAKGKLIIPVVYNSSGYETEEAIESLAPFVDVFLPDLKYCSAEISSKYSSAPDYFSVAYKAISAMLKARPKVIIEDGLIKKGVIIRHLVLPGKREDSLKIMDVIGENFNGALLSLMRQYTPDFATEDCDLKRRVTSFEYESVLNRAIELDLKGFFQDKESAVSSFTPKF